MLWFAVNGALLVLLCYHLPLVLHVAQNAQHSLFDAQLPWDDRVIAFMLSLPGVFPYAQAWVKDDKEGRLQIERERRQFNSFVNDKHDMQVQALGLVVRTVAVPTRDGGSVNVYLYTSAARSPSTEGSPLYLWLHGGGFVYGEGRDSLLLDAMPVCNATSADGSVVNTAVVASVEYRLPPEHRFPTATDDSEDALLWLLANADQLGVDRGRVSVGGTSAGGNLAAVLGQRALEAGVQLHFQLMLVPVIHYGCSTASCLSSHLAPLLGVPEILWFHHMYARPGSGGRSGFLDGAHPHYDPTFWGDRCKHFARGNATSDAAVRFPGSMVLVTAGRDALRDDGLDYVDYLRGCGAEVEHLTLPGSHWSVYQHADLYRGQLQRGVCG